MSSAVNNVAVLPKAELLALSRGKGNTIQPGIVPIYNSIIKVTAVAAAGLSPTLFYQGLPFYTDDDHSPMTELGYQSEAEGNNFGNYGTNARNFKAKTAWSDAWPDEAGYARLDLKTNAGPCIGKVTNGPSYLGRSTNTNGQQVTMAEYVCTKSINQPGIASGIGGIAFGVVVIGETMVTSMVPLGSAKAKEKDSGTMPRSLQRVGNMGSF
jgi:hypothetical protein